MLFDERHEPLALSTIEPDDRGEIGELFRAEVENLARQFTVDATRIEHQNLVLELLRLRFVQEPKLARYRARIKEIAPDRNYRFDMATLYEIAPQARFRAASGRRLTFASCAKATRAPPRTCSAEGCNRRNHRPCTASAG